MFRALGLSVLLVSSGALCVADAPSTSPQAYEAKDYSFLYGMRGFSKALLSMHFQLYQGYVKNACLLLDQLRALERGGKELTYEYGALKRRLGWEWDGMRLHELYFENLKSSPLDPEGALSKRLIADFGSYEAWKKSFVATGLIRGIGWVILYQDPKTGKLLNTWINEHDTGHLAGGKPLLVMDVFEHAYITEYGLDKARYIGAFFDNINWSEVSHRFSEPIGAK
jgi:Fe-Mn family superoxide dismutase